MNLRLRGLWLLAGAMLLGQAAFGQNGSHWVATWATAQQQPGGLGRGGGRGGAAPAPATPAASAGTLSAAPTPPAAPAAPIPAPSTLSNQTARMVVRTSIGGIRLRVHFSNAFGAVPVEIGTAHVALRSKDSAIVPDSDRQLLFSGKASARIMPGAELLSDAVELSAPALSDVAITVFVPGESGPASGHSQALHTTYIVPGDATGAAELTDAKTTAAWYWISSIDVMAPAEAAAIVAFGDSITDGATSTVNANKSWPSLLSERLAANPTTANVAILNLGISGNQVLGDGAGVSALARFDRDVLSHAGVKWLMILEGINDMNLAGRAPATGFQLKAEHLIAGMQQMIERAHAHGIRVIGCTLTPFGNATDKVEAMRQELNVFIRSSGAFDAVVDFDKVIRDPADQRQFIKEFNNTDKLHPNDAGYKAMADAVDLALFGARSATGK